MRRLSISIATLLAAALVLSGCQADGAPYAARVASTTISQSSLNSTLSSIASSSLARCLFTSGPVAGAGSGTYSQSFTATVLTFMVEREVVAQENAKLGLSDTALADQASAHLLTEALASPGASCAPDVTDVAAALPAAFRSLLSSYETDQALLAAHLAGTGLSPRALASFAAAHPRAVGVACASEIVVSSRSAALSIIAKVHAGTSFAALARSNSLDTSTSTKGGALGCGPESDFPTPYAAALAGLSAGQVSAPIALESPYYAVVTVTSRSAGNVLDAALGAVTLGSAQLGAAYNRLAASEVSVDPAYGRWGLEDGTYAVLSPSGPKSKYLSNLTALSPPTTTTPSTSG